jgi:hypothetical protein
VDETRRQRNVLRNGDYLENDLVEDVSSDIVHGSTNDFGFESDTIRVLADPCVVSEPKVRMRISRFNQAAAAW